MARGWDSGDVEEVEPHPGSRFVGGQEDPLSVRKPLRRLTETPGSRSSWAAPTPVGSIVSFGSSSRCSDAQDPTAVGRDRHRTPSPSRTGGEPSRRRVIRRVAGAPSFARFDENEPWSRRARCRVRRTNRARRDPSRGHRPARRPGFPSAERRAKSGPSVASDVVEREIPGHAGQDALRAPTASRPKARDCRRTLAAENQTSRPVGRPGQAALRRKVPREGFGCPSRAVDDVDRAPVVAGRTG